MCVLLDLIKVFSKKYQSEKKNLATNFVCTCSKNSYIDGVNFINVKAWRILSFGHIFLWQWVCMGEHGQDVRQESASRCGQCVSGQHGPCPGCPGPERSHEGARTGCQSGCSSHAAWTQGRIIYHPWK